MCRRIPNTIIILFIGNVLCVILFGKYYTEGLIQKVIKVAKTFSLTLWEYVLVSEQIFSIVIECNYLLNLFKRNSSAWYFTSVTTKAVGCPTCAARVRASIKGIVSVTGITTSIARKQQIGNSSFTFWMVANLSFDVCVCVCLWKREEKCHQKLQNKI